MPAIQQIPLIAGIGNYSFTNDDGLLSVHQVVPIRRDWNELGLIIDTYWAPNLNQIVWKEVDSTMIGLSSNEFAEGISAQTNQLEVIDNLDAVFYKTIVR